MITSQQLIDAWHSDKTMKDIALELGVSQGRLFNNWKRLQTCGALPMTRRPALTEIRRRAQTAKIVVTEEVDRDDDKKPLMDLLLERLIAVHGEPRYDIYPGAKP